MGGESIKPIRKRIHVYFLMTTYKQDKGEYSLKKNLKRIFSLYKTYWIILAIFVKTLIAKNTNYEKKK